MGELVVYPKAVVLGRLANCSVLFLDQAYLYLAYKCVKHFQLFYTTNTKNYQLNVLNIIIYRPEFIYSYQIIDASTLITTVKNQHLNAVFRLKFLSCRTIHCSRLLVLYCFTFNDPFFLFQKGDLPSYITRFQWDMAKYPIKQSLRNIADIISKQIGQIDADLKTKSNAYNQLKSNLQNMEKKQT